MINRYKKCIVIIFVILVIFMLLTSINVMLHKRNKLIDKDGDLSALTKKINSNDISDVDFDFINKNLNMLDDYIGKEIEKKDYDLKKKSSVYEASEKIYENMMIEIRYVLNEKLDDEDFKLLEKDLDEFNKNLDFAIEDIGNTIKSTIEADYYINKYKYEEKQNKCHEIINTYKGFLNLK